MKAVTNPTMTLPEVSMHLLRVRPKADCGINLLQGPLAAKSYKHFEKFVEEINTADSKKKRLRNVLMDWSAEAGLIFWAPSYLIAIKHQCGCP